MKELNVTATEFLNELELTENIEYYEDCKVVEAVIDNCCLYLLIEGSDVMGYVCDKEYYQPINCSIEFMMELIGFFNANNLTDYNDLVESSIGDMFERACDGGQFSDNIEVNVLEENEGSEVIAVCCLGDYASDRPYIYASRTKDFEIYCFYNSEKEALESL